jgi:lipoprotein-releasing system permease protein
MLAALGAPRRSVEAVFLLEGVMIGVLGVAIGGTVGLAIAYNVNEIFGVLVRLAELVAGAGAGRFAWFSPAYFYIESVPVRVLPLELVLTGAGALGAAVAAAYVAARRTIELRPAEILREE